MKRCPAVLRLRSGGEPGNEAKFTSESCKMGGLSFSVSGNLHGSKHESLGTETGVVCTWSMYIHCKGCGNTVQGSLAPQQIRQWFLLQTCGIHTLHKSHI